MHTSYSWYHWGCNDLIQRNMISAPINGTSNNTWHDVRKILWGCKKSAYLLEHLWSFGLWGKLIHHWRTRPLFVVVKIVTILPNEWQQISGMAWYLKNLLAKNSAVSLIIKKYCDCCHYVVFIVNILLRLDYDCWNIHFIVEMDL